jgi:hypothetical protein
VRRILTDLSNQVGDQLVCATPRYHRRLTGLAGKHAEDLGATMPLPSSSAPMSKRFVIRPPGKHPSLIQNGKLIDLELSAYICHGITGPTPAARQSPHDRQVLMAQSGTSIKRAS